jgi:hypothetical protein
MKGLTYNTKKEAKRNQRVLIESLRDYAYYLKNEFLNIHRSKTSLNWISPRDTFQYVCMQKPPETPCNPDIDAQHASLE